MLYPSINEIRKKADSRYTLVILAAKRARDIIDGKPTLVESAINKPVSIATEEIAEDKITYSRSFSTEQEALEIEREQHLAAAGMDLCGELLRDSDESLEEEEAVPYEEEGAEESQPEEEPAEE